MHGNVWEWCRDYYSASYYGSSPSSDPENLTSTSYRVLRGGSFDVNARFCRSANRNWREPSTRDLYRGLRPRADVTLP